MKIIAFGTLKGGTGKTSTLFNLGGLLAERHRVLLIDADPQFNLTTNAGISLTGKALPTLKDVFEGSVAASDVICKQPIRQLPNLDIIPSSIQLTATEINIVNLAGREQILNNFILDNHATLQEYDYILIDTNPNLGMINQNVFYAADKIVLVSDVSMNSITGAEFFMALWETVRRQLRKEENVAALLLNNSDNRMKLPRDLIAYVQTNDVLRPLLIDTVIPSSLQVKNTELDHLPINLLQGSNTLNREAIERVKAVFTAVLDELAGKGIL
jgi:chromosome partitioning protein